MKLILPSFCRVRYEHIDFKPEDIKMLEDKETGNILVTEEKTKLLMNRMRFPSLSLHGIFGGAEPGMTIIPAKVAGEFSIRFVTALAQILVLLTSPTLVSYRTKLQTPEA